MSITSPTSAMFLFLLRLPTCADVVGVEDEENGVSHGGGNWSVRVEMSSSGKFVDAVSNALTSSKGDKDVGHTRKPVEVVGKTLPSLFALSFSLFATP